MDHKNTMQNCFLCTEIFAIIENFFYDSENFAMIVNFRYHSIAKFSLSLRKFHYACEIANLLLLLPTSSDLLFLHLRLDEIDENSYELGIN